MRKVLLYFILLMAIILAGTVAYVSINGLLTVFSGAGILGLLFFSAIEISKIVATSAIHTYGKKIGWVYNGLLALGIIIAMGITSMGVYGFLSSGYQKNVAKSDGSDREIALLDNKIKLKEENRKSINYQLLETQKSITQLRNALGSNTQSRVDSKGNVITSSSTGNRKAFESQLKIATESEVRLNNDLNSADSLINVLSENKIILETNAATSTELGPLKYLADVTGSSMDNVMKWFILLLIMIGDPMAILMIIIFNKIINDKDDDISEISEGVNEGVNEISEGVSEISEGVNDFEWNEETGEIKLPDELLDIQAMSPPDGSGILSVMDIVEEPKQIDRTIKLEDLPEKNRGFSVNIPDRKLNNSVERIGSNKELRGDEPGKVFFKKR
jgi:hypothetical protein